MFVIIISAVMIGLSLGLLGSGGAILTVPALIYGVGMNEKSAIASALFIVASISLFSSVNNIITQKIAWKNISGFAIPGLFASYLGALAGSYIAGYIQLFIFAMVILFAAFHTLKLNNHAIQKQSSLPKIIMTGFLVGFLTGLVGVGGGFLIVPALIILLNLPLRQAVASSLIIISLNSLVAFGRYAITFNRDAIEFNWLVIIIFILLGTCGSYLGQFFANKLNPKWLQQGFAYLLICLSIFTFYQSIKLI
ncbi:sulfite exporter TauE/SafE family protein [Catenovulum sp. 2E275]|uniref:sulfite exporter TauE/SafE family protein n=1 Tax=Catenovulum sp. 2E275 TaxID=2980497 RepID=UPI0021D17E14|nr:sulfite exporter TauE/SafE family protein [Catenovulum sp. 2E275]MCU4674576.1 sulfite exporter TauE/SafE family protein [Catenovulum sp. 2E275]